MRILDKYLLKEFTLPFLYCFDAFLMLWIVGDLFGSLDEFIDHHARAGQVAHYYLYKFPEAFAHILPMSLLLGLLFCLTNLGKHNELTAMRASGVSLSRLACPLLGVGLAATLVVFVVNEMFGPRADEQADALMTVLKGRGQRDIVDNYFYTEELQHRTWYARRFNKRTGSLEGAEIQQENPDGTAQLKIFARQASWVNGAWRFADVVVHDYTQSRSAPVVVHVAETNFPSFRESPKRLAAAVKRPEQMTIAELQRTIRVLSRAGRAGHRPEYQVSLQYRYAFPLTCLMVVWIGIPLGMRVSRSGPLLGVGTALLLVVAFYFMTHITLAMGTGGRIPPVVAAWLTNVVFAVVGAVLLARVR